MSTLDVPGARLHYEIRGSGPLLVMIGAPMDSSGFAALAPLMSGDHTVVTYDPRGTGRSAREDPTSDVTADLLADDVHRLLTALGDEPVDVLGSSGGAVTGLALATRHPDQVRTLVAHEPPVVDVLPDRKEVRAAIFDLVELYHHKGPAAATREFMALTGIDMGPAGDVTADAPDDGEDLFFAHMLRTITGYAVRYRRSEGDPDAGRRGCWGNVERTARQPYGRGPCRGAGQRAGGVRG
ncbi:alpha/beta fold hydrolase [Fodinicola feengrottensis]|uniref:alpha/beta fold hydrolase n=1 Tax=Fodinicola feengrottensis TaxID=435914 RepID=UPI0024427B91|nr:alpha/beta hydrolase [Fodinicola feengrottensis]